MNISKEEYKKLYEKHSPTSPSYRTIPAAFVVGGAICTLGQALRNWYEGMDLGADEVSAAVSMSLIFLGILCTALGLYGKFAKFAGAGTLVPITGFANSMASPAIEFKSEGFILGTCVKMFTIAGPVIVFGITSSIIYGLILCLLGGA